MSRGSKDYTLDVHRAAVYNLYKLRANESLVALATVFSDEASLFSFVKGVLASGNTAHLVDTATGSDTPYTIPAGYEFTAVMFWYSFDQPLEVRIYVDTQLYAKDYPEVPGTWYENDVVTFQVGLIDPTYASAHSFDLTMKNLGALDLKGEGFVGCILEAMGTPPLPATKTVKCKWACPGFAEVPVDATRWTCPICGKETWFYGRKVI